MLACMRACVHVCVCVRVCVRLCVCVCARAHVRANVRISARCVCMHVYVGAFLTLYSLPAPTVQAFHSYHDHTKEAWVRQLGSSLLLVNCARRALSSGPTFSTKEETVGGVGLPWPLQVRGLRAVALHVRAGVRLSGCAQECVRPPTPHAGSGQSTSRHDAPSAAADVRCPPPPPRCRLALWGCRSSYWGACAASSRTCSGCWPPAAGGWAAAAAACEWAVRKRVSRACSERWQVGRQQ